jgi:hypothetical protein
MGKINCEWLFNEHLKIFIFDFTFQGGGVQNVVTPGQRNL